MMIQTDLEKARVFFVQHGIEWHEHVNQEHKEYGTAVSFEILHKRYVWFFDDKERLLKSNDE